MKLCCYALDSCFNFNWVVIDDHLFECDLNIIMFEVLSLLGEDNSIQKLWILPINRQSLSVICVIITAFSIMSRQQITLLDNSVKISFACYGFNIAIVLGYWHCICIVNCTQFKQMKTRKFKKFLCVPVDAFIVFVLLLFMMHMHSGIIGIDVITHCGTVLSIRLIHYCAAIIVLKLYHVYRIILQLLTDSWCQRYLMRMVMKIFNTIVNTTIIINKTLRLWCLGRYYGV